MWLWVHVSTQYVTPWETRILIVWTNEGRVSWSYEPIISQSYDCVDQPQASIMIVCTNKGRVLYLAMMMPRLAEQTQAASMKAPCRKMNSRDLDSRLPTSPRPRSEAAITFLSWKFMSPVSESTRPCSQSEVSIVRVLTNHSPVLPGRASRGSGPCPGPSRCPL